MEAIMHQVNIHEAKTHLSRLIQEAVSGEEVIIAKGNKPIVKLVPLTDEKPTRQLGGSKGLVEYIASDFDAPLDDFAEYQ